MGVDVHFTSPSRRVFGFLAAGTIGLSTALLGVTGVAQAEPVAEPAAASAEDGTPVAAAATTPDAPYLNFVGGGDGSATLNFVPPQDNGVAVTGYEVSTDGGTSWASVTVSVTDGRSVATVTGLTNGQTYSVSIRAQSAGGPSWESNSQDVVPYRPLSAPTNVVATAGSSFIKVTWDASTGGAVASYSVGYSMGESGNQACAVPAADPRGCVFAATPGSIYSVTVFGVDTDGRMGLAASVTPSAATTPTVPSAVPAKSGDLTRPAGRTGSVGAGNKVTLSGTGYLPNSTIAVAIYSEPQVLTTVVTDSSGSFTVEVTVPDGLAAGEHTLVASGVDAAGNVRYLNLAVTVSASGAATLAYTGADVLLPALGGLAAVALGAGLIVVRRRTTGSAA